MPDSRGVEIVSRAERVHGVPGVPEGTLAASIFVVNRRQPESTAARNPRRDEGEALLEPLHAAMVEREVEVSIVLDASRETVWTPVGPEVLLQRVVEAFWKDV